MSTIENVSFEMKYYEYVKPFHITSSISSSATNIEVTIITRDGIVGKGEISPSFRVNGEKAEALIGMEKYVQEMIVGMDVKNYRAIFNLLDKFFATPSLKAAVQFAVLDAFSKELNTKVSYILGGAKESIESDKTVGIDTIENMVKEAKEIYEEGYKVIKIKVGEDLKKDIEAIQEIAKVTKGANYIVDANMGYSPKEAIMFAKTIYQAGIDIAVFEQPVKASDISGLKFVRFHSPFPVAADESARSKYDVARLIREEAIDYVNIKLMKSGISDALSIVEICKSNNIKLMIGCMAESSLGINQSVHFALGIGAFDFHDLDSHLLLKEEFRGDFKQEGPIIKI